MVTNAGGGYSRRQQMALTRWREDVTTDAWGSFCYVRDLDAGDVWSATYQPTAREPEEYEVTFAPDRAVWRRLDAGIETRTEVVVSPEDDAELRRVSLTNHSAVTRSARPHQLRGGRPRAGRRRPVAPGVQQPVHRDPQRAGARRADLRPASALGRAASRTWCTCSAAAAAWACATQYETDRARFIGRGGTLERPAALVGQGRRCRTRRAPSSIRSSAFVSRCACRPARRRGSRSRPAYAESEEAALHLIEKYHDRRAVARALALASTHSQIELRHLDLTVEDTIAFQRLGGRLLTGDTRLRDGDAVEENRRGQRELWKYGISGDLPILLVRVADEDAPPLVVELLKAHEYLRLKGLPFDLVILNDHPPSYLHALHEELQRLIESGPEQAWIDKPGGVFLRRADLMPPEDQLLLRAAARAVMDAADGGLRNQLTRSQVPFVAGPTRSEVSDRATPIMAPVPPSPSAADRGLELFNGLGGFADDGREYVMRVECGDRVSRPRRGRMSSPTDASGSPAPSQAPDTRGRRTATTTG